MSVLIWLLPKDRRLIILCLLRLIASCHSLRGGYARSLTTFDDPDPGISADSKGGNLRWNEFNDLLNNLENEASSSGRKVAAFDLDGTIIREKPLLGEVSMARDFVCSSGAYQQQWPFSFSRQEICGVTRLNLEKGQVYELLMMPFTGKPMEYFSEAAIRWVSAQKDLLYQGFADLLHKLAKRGWEILLVSVSLRDFVQAVADVYELPVKVVSSEPDSWVDPITGQRLRGQAPSFVLNRELKVEVIRKYLHQPLNKDVKQGLVNSVGSVPPLLLAVGNSGTDLNMCQFARLGIMVDHDAKDECFECYYKYWDEAELKKAGVRRLSMLELPRTNQGVRTSLFHPLPLSDPGKLLDRSRSLLTRAKGNRSASPMRVGAHVLRAMSPS